jgi:hypothetical protein
MRNIVIVGALLTLSSAGAIFAANSAVSAVAGKLTICHRTNSNTNPYVEITPSINGVINGHEGHTGPIWDPTLKAQHIKWGDIIPPFTGFAGQNWTAEGQQILANGCDIPNTVVPVDPTVTQSVCNSDHNATVPEVDLPTTPGINYSIAPDPVAGGVSVVTAAAITPANWFTPPPPTGWAFVDLDTETFTITFDAAPNCKTTVVPADPTVTQSTCDGTTAQDPIVDLATTTGITYTEDTAPVAGGTTVVTATADSGAGDQFVAPAPAGWVFVDAHTETFTITFDAAPDCSLPETGVNPVSPTVTDPTCAGSPSQLVAPTLTLATTAGIAYTASANAPYTGGQSVTVTATSDGTHVFSAPAPSGWTFVNAHSETFGVTFAASPTCSGDLANTGVKTQQMIELGGIVLLFGVGLQFISMGMRRRNEF